jgi:hypothetical protein
MEEIMLYTKLMPLAALAGLLVAAQSASAQQMGRGGYNFPVRNPSLAAQFQFQRRLQQQQQSNAASGLSALNQYINTHSTTYSSNSTSIGNMNTVNQTLSGGSQGSVGQSTDQQSTGNQGSDAKTRTTVDNSIVSTKTITPPPSSNQ